MNRFILALGFGLSMATGAGGVLANSLGRVVESVDDNGVTELSNLHGDGEAESANGEQPASSNSSAQGTDSQVDSTPVDDRVNYLSRGDRKGSSGAPNASDPDTGGLANYPAVPFTMNSGIGYSNARPQPVMQSNATVLGAQRQFPMASSTTVPIDTQPAAAADVSGNTNLGAAEGNISPTPRPASQMSVPFSADTVATSTQERYRTRMLEMASGQGTSADVSQENPALTRRYLMVDQGTFARRLGR